MTSPDDAQRTGASEPDREHVQARAQLLPEEQSVDSDDPQAQAEAVLQESAERTEGETGIVPADGDDASENTQSRHRRSEDTTPPPA